VSCNKKLWLGASHPLRALLSELPGAQEQSDATSWPATRNIRESSVEVGYSGFGKTITPLHQRVYTGS